MDLNNQTAYINNSLITNNTDNLPNVAKLKNEKIKTLKEKGFTVTNYCPFSFFKTIKKVLQSPIKTISLWRQGNIKNYNCQPITVQNSTETQKTNPQIINEGAHYAGLCNGQGLIGDVIKTSDGLKGINGKVMTLTNHAYKSRTMALVSIVNMLGNEKFKNSTDLRSRIINFLSASQKYCEHLDKGDTQTKEFGEKIKSLGYKEDLSGNFYNEKSGTIFSLIFDDNKNEIVMSFKGLGSQNNLNFNEPEKDLGTIDRKTDSKETKALRKKIGTAALRAVVNESLGGVPLAAVEAIELGKYLKTFAQSRNCTPVIVGHSHGGGLAQCASLSNGIKCFVYNPRPLGDGVCKYLGKQENIDLEEMKKNITAFNVEGDWLTRNKVCNKLAVWIEKYTSLSVPRTLGTEYVIPAPNEKDLHNAYYEALIAQS